MAVIILPCFNENWAPLAYSVLHLAFPLFFSSLASQCRLAVTWRVTHQLQKLCVVPFGATASRLPFSFQVQLERSGPQAVVGQGTGLGGQEFPVSAGGQSLPHLGGVYPLLPRSPNLLEGPFVEDESLWLEHSHDVSISLPAASLDSWAVS